MMETYEDKSITLGNLAKLAHMGRDTLSFYSRKGLIRPVYVGENGYKYFLPEQVQTINFIRFYRKLDFPLETIQHMLDTQQKLDEESAFKNQQAYLKQKIEDFRSAEKFLENEKRFLRYIIENQNDTPFIEEIEEKRFYLTPIRFCHSLNVGDNAQKISDFFIRDGSFRIPEYPICCVIPREALQEGHFCAYVHGDAAGENDRDSLTSGEEDGTIVRSAGRYASMIHSGGTGTIFPSIKKVLDYLEREGIAVAGDAYVINSYNFLNVTEGQNSDYIIQIRIEDKAS